MKEFWIRWDAEKAQYKVSIPNYDGGRVYDADEVDALLAQQTKAFTDLEFRFNKVLKYGPPNLEQRAVNQGRFQSLVNTGSKRFKEAKPSWTSKMCIRASRELVKKNWDRLKDNKVTMAKLLEERACLNG